MRCIDIKTLIELFDECQIENVIAGLRFKPEKIIFVGYKNNMSSKRKSDIEKFLGNHCPNTVLEYEIVGRYDMSEIIDRLKYVLNNNEDCCIDMTGGKELVLAAVGDIADEYKVPMFQFNIRSENFIKIKNCENIEEPPKVPLRIKEYVALNGGAVLEDEKEDFKWILDKNFKNDIEKIWNICKQNCGLWNRQSGIFGSFEKMGKIDENFNVTVDINRMKGKNHDTMLNPGIIRELINEGLIFDYCLSDGYLSFRYKNREVHQCILKAGNILELYTYIIAAEINEEEPGFYDDMDIGVFLDWDGVIHSAYDKLKDTKNEIDVMLMKDTVPVFISCKNGEVHKEALYELDTVAERFGGEYSRKVLVSTYVSRDNEGSKYLIQRARDMNIRVIDSVDKIGREEFKEALKRAAK